MSVYAKLLLWKIQQKQNLSSDGSTQLATAPTSPCKGRQSRPAARTGINVSAVGYDPLWIRTWHTGEEETQVKFRKESPQISELWLSRSESLFSARAQLALPLTGRGRHCWGSSSCPGRAPWVRIRQDLVKQLLCFYLKIQYMFGN